MQATPTTFVEDNTAILILLITRLIMIKLLIVGYSKLDGGSECCAGTSRQGGILLHQATL